MNSAVFTKWFRSWVSGFGLVLERSLGQPSMSNHNLEAQVPEAQGWDLSKTVPEMAIPEGRKAIFSLGAWLISWGGSVNLRFSVVSPEMAHT